MDIDLVYTLRKGGGEVEMHNRAILAFSEDCLLLRFSRQT